MMIPPSIFYEMQIQGKSAEEIKTNIRGLKRRINHLKRVLEHPDYTSTFHPSEDVQLWCNREYLKVAIEALKTMGEEYHPSKAEQKALDFNENIPNISKIDFHIGGFFGPCTDVTVVIDDSVHIYINNIESPATIPSEDYEEYTKEEFFRFFADLHMGEWSHSYDLFKYGCSVCDGTQWELTIEYNNGRKPFKSSGDNAYPYNFKKFLDVICLEDEYNDWDDDEDSKEE